jgi:hypothetical protein
MVVEKIGENVYSNGMTKQEEFISEFLDSATIAALKDFIEKSESYYDAADLIAVAFGAEKGFSKMPEDGVNKLVISFKNNLTLLIQKTWVEKSDIALKDELLYRLEKFITEDGWKDSYELFRNIINQAVFLMFGQSTDSPDFAEYTMRIDPEFGIFWWYISNLPPKTEWSEEKSRIAMMVGMYFLANY